MEPWSLLIRLHVRGCRFVTRTGTFVLMENGDRRAVIPYHRGLVPRRLATKIAESLGVTLR